MNKFLTLVMKTLSTKIAPMVYIMMFVSVFIGFCFMTGLLVAGAESVLYDTGVLVHRQIWGGVLFVTATTAMTGFITKTAWMIESGGIAGFMAWLFASISLIIEAHFYILVSVALFHLLFHGYVYLASRTGLLYRVAFTEVRG